MRTVFDKHKLAWKHFWPEGNGKAKEGYCLHHKDETLKTENPERYAEWRFEDLTMITIGEHLTIHHTGFVYSKESKEKMSASHIGRFTGENSPHYGKRLSDETKRKISEARTGKYAGENCPSFGRSPSEETRNKISNTLKGNIPWNKGKKATEEQKRKLSESHKGIIPSEETRKKRSESCKKAWALRKQRKENIHEAVA